MNWLIVPEFGGSLEGCFLNCSGGCIIVCTEVCWKCSGNCSFQCSLPHCSSVTGPHE